MRDAYIVTSVRTPGCRRSKGAFKDTRPEDLLSFILESAVDKTESLEKKDVDDVMIGCSFPEAEQGLNIGRIEAKNKERAEKLKEAVRKEWNERLANRNAGPAR